MFTKFIARFTLLALLAGVLWMFWSVRPIRHPVGVLIASPPVQKEMPPRSLPDIEGWKLTAVAGYELRGRVLDTKRYRSGRTADLVPIDVAVGWGRMSDQAVLDKLTISMTNRFFFYEWPDQPPIPQDEIVRSAANNHIIAANADVRRVVRSLKSGHIIAMKGYLVTATGPDGGTWPTSLTREDTGNGACELFYVESARAVSSLGDDM
jgi:hypothetical protein